MVDEIKKEPDKVEENGPKTIIKVVLHPDGHSEMVSSMQPPMVVYILMQIVMNLTQPKEHSRILKPGTGGILNFARKLKHR